MVGSFIKNDLKSTMSPREFGETSVTWRGIPLTYAIFDDEDVEIETGDGVKEIYNQAILTTLSDHVTGIASGDPIVIDSTPYSVRSWKDDGTGLIEIYLEK